jgi:hypothetical protein
MLPYNTLPYPLSGGLVPQMDTYRRSRYRTTTTTTIPLLVVSPVIYGSSALSGTVKKGLTSFEKEKNTYTSNSIAMEKKD